MNKLAQYLNQHLLGEVATDSEVRKRFSTDNSPFTIIPDMVVYPRLTNDIRKLLKFSWQLAEKGHILSVTPRGGGTDATGGSIGSGVVLNISTHMNTIFELDARQRLVRLQPGVTVGTLQSSLYLHGLRISALQNLDKDATIGGVLAAGLTSPSATEWVDQMEIVLSSGDVLQTKRLSKKELNKKKGLQGFEGDIYRGVDALIEDNREIINELLISKSSTGYNGLAQVKQGDGSFDLLPLLAGSQGTLGIISEMIIRADFAPLTESLMVVGFADQAHALDVLDALAKFKPSVLEYIDGSIIDQANKQGKELPFKIVENPRALLIITLADSSVRTQSRKIKKLSKTLKQQDIEVLSTEDARQSELASIHSVVSLGLQTEDGVLLPLADGMRVPLEYADTFLQGVKELEERYKTPLLICGRPLEGQWTVRPVIALSKVSGKQLVLKFVDDISQLVARCGGTMAYQNGEGRLQSYSTHRQLDDRAKKLFVDIKTVFDPHGTLNVGVKESSDIKMLVKGLRSSYVPQGKDALPHI